MAFSSGLNSKPAYPGPTPHTDKEMSVRVEKIKNGFLSHCSTSHSDAKGNYQYNNEKTYHRTDPTQNGRIGRIMANLKKLNGQK